LNEFPCGDRIEAAPIAARIRQPMRLRQNAQQFFVRSGMSVVLFRYALPSIFDDQLLTRRIPCISERDRPAFGRLLHETRYESGNRRQATQMTAQHDDGGIHDGCVRVKLV
jgi:hypothetical protein